MHCDSFWFSCRGRCTQERELGGTEERLQCFCDNSCEFFRDCCADFDQHCSSSGLSTQETKLPDNGFWECVENDHLADVIGVWAISFCPRNWTRADIEKLCRESAILSYETHKDTLPVIDLKGFTYKNHYCAQCHDLDLKDLTYYNLKFSCDVPAPKGDKGSETLKFLFTFCHLFYWQPPAGASRRYCHRVSSNDNCSDDSLPEKVQQKCVNGSLRVVYEKNTATPKNFFNPYCALCSGVQDIECGPGISKDIRYPPLAKPFSLVMNLDFSGDDSETSTVCKHEVSCRKGDVYDFYLQVCRPGIAEPSFTSFHSNVFSVSVWMSSNMSTSGIPLLTEDSFKEGIADKLKLNETLLSNISIENPLGPVSTVVFNINANPTTRKNFSIQTFRTEMSSLSIANFTVFKVLVKPFDCSVTEIFDPHEYAFERNAVKINDTGEIFQETDFYTDKTQWINGSLVPIGILTVCKQTRLNCSGVFVGLNKSEYVILSNGSVYRNISRESFQLGEFQLIDGTIWVCVRFSSSYTEEIFVNSSYSLSATKDDIVLVILTYVGLSLSILSLFLFLVTYLLFKELRTVPGINLMNLSLSYLLADSLYLATGYVNVTVACTMIAILLHYIFLVSFMWMSIIAFEICLAFSKIRIQHRNPSRMKRCFNLARRIMSGWLPPFVFVLVCFALDQSNVVVFHYGGIKGCWINNATANLYFFVLPVAFSILFNTVFFVLTVRAIRKTNSETRKATHEKQLGITSAVFFKMFILMGFTWIFGFLKALVSKYFEYPFIIFTTLQGLYIALAFVFTSRVKQMYRTLLCTEKTNSSSRGQDTRL